MNLNRPLVAFAAVIAGAALLSGCVAHIDPDAPLVPVTETTAPAAPELEVGQAIDADTADALEPPFYGYPLPDGTYIVINRNEPLPEVVQNDLDAQVTAYADAITPQSYIDSGETQIKAILGSAAVNTGKRIVMIARIEGIRTASGSEAVQTWYWAWGAGNINGDAGFDTVGAAVTAAEGWVAQQDKPEQFAIIVPQQ